MPLHVRTLADTGALLACLDRSDRWHERCRDAFGQLRLPLSTSTAVLTELFHLLGDNPREVDVAWAFVRSGAVTILPISDRDLPGIEALISHPDKLADAEAGIQCLDLSDRVRIPREPVLGAAGHVGLDEDLPRMFAYVSSAEPRTKRFKNATWGEMSRLASSAWPQSVAASAAPGARSCDWVIECASDSFAGGASTVALARGHLKNSPIASSHPYARSRRLWPESPCRLAR